MNNLIAYYVRLMLEIWQYAMCMQASCRLECGGFFMNYKYVCMDSVESKGIIYPTVGYMGVKPISMA